MHANLCSSQAQDMCQAAYPSDFQIHQMVGCCSTREILAVSREHLSRRMNTETCTLLQHNLMDRTRACRKQLKLRLIWCTHLHGVLLCKHGCPEENVRSLLEGGLLQGPALIAVNAVPGDGHEVASGGHAVAQNCQMAIVHVGAIKLNDAPYFLHQGSSGSLDAQRLDDVRQVVAHCARVIHTRKAHDLCAACRLQMGNCWLSIEASLCV